MPLAGELGLDMMKRTTTIQANSDFASESDMKKFRVAQSIQPVIIALYANSPFIDGKLTEFLSYRSRSGLKQIKIGVGFYLLFTRMIFRLRDMLTICLMFQCILY